MGRWHPRLSPEEPGEWAIVGYRQRSRTAEDRQQVQRPRLAGSALDGLTRSSVSSRAHDDWIDTHRRGQGAAVPSARAATRSCVPILAPGEVTLGRR